MFELYHLDSLYLKFGEVVKDDIITLKSETTSGVPLYGFNPKKPFSYFKRYYFQMTPKSKKVYSIWGVTTYSENSKCVTDLKIIKGILEKKYGQFEAPSFSFDVVYSYSGENATITLKCDNNLTDADLYIYYTDDNLKDKAKSEKIEIESENNDTSGL